MQNTLPEKSLPVNLNRISMVYSGLIYGCLNLYVSTLRDLERHWALDPEDVERLGLKSCPSFATNLIAAGALAKKFGDLGDVPGFYRFRNLWWIDLDERLAHRGLILPIRDRRCPHRIVDLQIFRHARDPHPFLLRTRTAERAAA